MANYYATTRSNYFRVKDAAAFEAWCRKWSFDFWTKDIEGCGRCYAISADTGDCNGWARFDSEQDGEIDIAVELAEHLDVRDAAVLVEVGSEKLRYLIGNAMAVHPDGRTVHVILEEIYLRAKKAFGTGINVLHATY
jgi:hypothetical protein